MARKLKTYQTSLGFHDLAIAAPSMKAALQAWGAGSNLFHQRIARETDDPAIVAATMAQPGIVLKRPAGSSGRFSEHSDLPTRLNDERVGDKRPQKRAKSRGATPKISDKAARKAAVNFEKEEKRREAERRREEAQLAKQRRRRQQAVAKAEAALERAREDHEARAAAIDAERAAIDKRAEDEEGRWQTQKARLEQALRRARE